MKMIKLIATVLLLNIFVIHSKAEILFESDFSSAFNNWKVVHPTGKFNTDTYWQYDPVEDTIFENSGSFSSDNAGMLIYDTPTSDEFEIKAQLISGDDDGIGLVFGFIDKNNYYRIIFTSEERDFFPGWGWILQQIKDGNAEHLAGDDYTENWEPEFTYYQEIPFNVSISIANKKISINVQDDPDEGGEEYQIVNDLEIESNISGNFGLLSWNQSGGIPSGSHFKNIYFNNELIKIENPLKDWESVIPYNSEGDDFLDGGNEGFTNWSVGISESTNFGKALTESSNTGLNGTEIELGDTVESNIDWIGGMLVTGDVNWEDYRITTSFKSSPHCAFTGCYVNAFGLIFRYKDPENFYRLSFSSRNPGDNLPRQGVSIQKVVGGEWSEVFWEKGAAFSPSKFIPSSNEEKNVFDLSLTISGNQLEFTIVGDPSGQGKIFNYGPIEIQGNQSGKVGFFSYYQKKLNIDFLKVEEVAGIPLEIFSKYGTPIPMTGLTNFEPETKLTATVESPIIDVPGYRRKVTGWNGTGSVPKSGIWFLPGNPRVSFTLKKASSLTWNWKTEVKLDITSTEGGRIVGATSKWYTEGTKLVITAIPSANYMFSGWSGSISSIDKKLTIYSEKPADLTATFIPDIDNDNLDDNWEIEYIGNLSEDGNGDFDNDGSINLLEYKLRTNPAKAEELTNFVFSNWINTNVSNPYTAGRMVYKYFDARYKGIWENSNTIFRGSNENEYADWDGQRLILKEAVWKDEWADAVYEATFAYGDIDTCCIYFRYQDEDNWYRASLSGRDFDGTWPLAGLSLQKKIGGKIELIDEYDDSIYPDPLDEGYKVFKLKVSATGDNFSAKVVPYDPIENIFNDDDSSDEISFTDNSLRYGLAGIGFGHQGPYEEDTTTENVPVGEGALLMDFTISNGEVVFQDSWDFIEPEETLPPGWIDPFKNQSLGGEWLMNAHGGFVQLNNAYSVSPSVKDILTADADSSMLIGPMLESNYLLKFGFISNAANDYLTAIDGLGFIYDFKDIDNYARVLIVNTKDMALDNGSSLPRGINVTRKVNGEWKNIITGNRSFSYVRGRPFEILFTSENGNYHMSIQGYEPKYLWNQWRNSYFPSTPTEIKQGAKSAELHWVDQKSLPDNKFGITTWGSPLANIFKTESYSLSAKVPTAPNPATLKITIASGELSITWEGQGNLETSTEVTGPWSPTGFTKPIKIKPSEEQSYFRVVR